MKHKRQVIAGTALGLLMASAPLAAYPLQGAGLDAAHQPRSAVILAQADCPEGDKNCEQGGKRQRRDRRQPAKEQAQPEQRQKKAREQQAPAEQAKPRDQDEAEQQQPRRQRKERPTQAEAAPEQDDQQPQRDRKRPSRTEQPAPAAKTQVVPEQQPEQQQQRRQRKERPPQSEEQPSAREAAREQKAAQEEQQRRRERRQRQSEQQAPTAEPQAVPDQEAAPAKEAQPQRRPRGERKSQPDQTAQPDSAPAQKAPGAPASERPPVQAGDAPRDPNAGRSAAPIFDSQKETPRQRPRRDGQQREQAAKPAPVDQGPPPQSDRAATEAAQPQRVESVRREEGRRVERRPDDNSFRRRERPEGLDVVREIGDRVIIRFGDQVAVESNDRPRISRGAQDVYYEDLPRGRIRETIVRRNGNQIVTIRNRYGDVIRRSRITPDGREYVLSYVDESNYDRVREWRDPGYDLPPMRLAIPVEEYILDAAMVDDPDDYYDFLEQPPVERVERLYSVDEVKRSARVRDIARRVDLDTLTFEFGSAEVPESQIEKLEGVANAIDKLLAKNPAETFLIEGHTDAVGSDEANLALSDRRAEAVAEALTNVFAIPPENLATQGYGERYLKVNTATPEQENRRVAIRRITPLVAPVASAD